MLKPQQHFMFGVVVVVVVVFVLVLVVVFVFVFVFVHGCALFWVEATMVRIGRLGSARKSPKGPYECDTALLPYRGCFTLRWSHSVG
jgi:hypothetical protein